MYTVLYFQLNVKRHRNENLKMLLEIRVPEHSSNHTQQRIGQTGRKNET